VQERKEEAEDIAREVAQQLDNESARVRKATVASLKTLGSAGEKALPNLSPLLLDHWDIEKEAAVKDALLNLLRARLAQLKRKQMKELLPLLRHRDTVMVIEGLKIVQKRKQDAAELVDAVAELLKNDTAEVREQVLGALKALGPAAGKALPKLMEVIEQTPKYERTHLALTAACLVGTKDTDAKDRLVPFLLEGLHPKALGNQGETTEAEIHRTLVKIGQPAVDGCFTILSAILELQIAGRDNVDYREKLYETLARLGPTCKSEANIEMLTTLLNKEYKKKYRSVIAAAGNAKTAMTPR
jgi:hypothetical protein